MSERVPAHRRESSGHLTGPELERERLAWRREQWKYAADTLSRIKQDEQRWLGVAFLIFGAILSVFLLGAFGTELKYLLAWQRRVMFGVGLVVVNAVGWVWFAQSLTLREQYYRTLCRLWRAAIALGDPLPSAWHRTTSGPLAGPAAQQTDGSSTHRATRFSRALLTRLRSGHRSLVQGLWRRGIRRTLSEENRLDSACLSEEAEEAEHWRARATQPGASKFTEILTVSTLVIAAVAVGAFRLDPLVGQPPRDMEVEATPAAPSDVTTEKITLAGRVPDTSELEGAKTTGLGKFVLDTAAEQHLRQQLCLLDRLVGYVIAPLACLLWPFAFYPLWDRWKLARLWYSDVRSLQLELADSCGNCDAAKKEI